MNKIEQGAASCASRIPAADHDEQAGDEADHTGPEFVVRGGLAWRAPTGLIRRLAEAYPGTDIDGELLKAAIWTATNPTKAKTPGGMPRFLNGWLRRTADRPQPPTHEPSDGMPAPSAEAIEFARRIERGEAEP